MAPLADRAKIRTLRACVSAGETLPVATRTLWEDATGVRIIDGIGSTEMLHIFIAASGDEIRPGATGKPVPGYVACVLDDDGKPLPPGNVGRLAVKGPTGCRYLADPRQRDYVQHGWNLTGDAYLLDEDGYFWYQARTDDMIISSGYNIAGPEVEGALLEHPRVLECAVVAAPDEARGTIVKAFVVLREGAGERGAGDGAARLREIADRAVQIPARDRVRRRAAAHADRQAATLQAAHGGGGGKDMTILQPPGWPRPKGFSCGVSGEGTVVFVSGQIGWDEQGRFPASDIAGQVRQALRNVVAILAEAGARPEHVARLTWYVTDKREYLAAQREIGEAYRAVMGRYFPAMSVVAVAALLEDEARVEIEATAIVPR